MDRSPLWSLLVYLSSIISELLMLYSMLLVVHCRERKCSSWGYYLFCPQEEHLSSPAALETKSAELFSRVTGPFRLIASSYTDHRIDSVWTERTLWVEPDMGSRPTPLVNCVALDKLPGFCIIHKVGKLSNCYRMCEVWMMMIANTYWVLTEIEAMKVGDTLWRGVGSANLAMF